jgi:hypothetical protein
MWQFASLGAFWWRYFNYVSGFLFTYPSFTYQVKVTGLGHVLASGMAACRGQVRHFSSEFYHWNQIEYGVNYAKRTIYQNTRIYLFVHFFIYIAVLCML